jgi:hypothetical protein
MLSLNCTFLSFIRFLRSDLDRIRPGDYLKPGEDDIDGLKARLDDRLAPPVGTAQFGEGHGMNNDWEIGDCLAQWWRPNFETFMVRFFRSRVGLGSDIEPTVSLHPRAHHKTEGMQETLSGSDA